MTNRSPPDYILQDTYCPVWLGVLFLFLGVMCILSERFPKPIVTFLNGLLSLGGVALSITAIVYYSMAVDEPSFYSLCRSDDCDWYHSYTTTVAPTDSGLLLERCQEARALLLGLDISLLSILIILSLLDLSLGISAAVFSFKTLKLGLRANRNQERLEEAEKTTQEEFSTEEKE
uniref:Uncharacterized protein n=1 Tax=Neogobius melanostomus TaxID=47308 RepID=A0A8C6UDX7_9GOBI